ncbi:MAG TPA: rhomboid family intramembrane serine protease [Kiritimatiellia bacterium]|nr:rhomboid family intramembrane serine protease [Kiritimatiellia bacterium]HRZ13193.1 rhomboid family intramembrane serine protease [Kiritimatiellia bacterium]HSA19760.1 rhomboid family intramembrane serine protease [Kiritimatiellia bacterium]
MPWETKTAWAPPGRWNFPPAVRALLFGTVGLSLFQWVADDLTGGAFTRWFGLSWLSLRRGLVWTPVTYIFLHGGVFHLLMNMLVLFFLGPETERALGSRKFLLLYFISGLLGGLGWVWIEDSPLVTCIGASGAVFGILGAFAALFPNQPITLLLFYVVPVTLRAWVLAVILGLVELMFLLSPGSGSVANAAHLAGGLAGYFYALGLVRGERSGARSWRKVAKLFTPPPADDARELDRLLDKIANHGLHSLTPREREWLDRASRARRGS